MADALDDLNPEQRAGVAAASKRFLDNMAKTGISSISMRAGDNERVDIDLDEYRERQQQPMTTAIKYDPQLALDEAPLDDGTLESLLEDLADAKERAKETKAYLNDYLDRLTLDGKYRVGRFRILVAQRRTLGVSVPKPKKERR